MASPRVGGIRTVSERETDEAGAQTDPSPPPGLSAYKHVFQTSKASLVLSLKRRKIHWLPDGSKEEEIPTTTDGNRLDMVRATDFFVKTNDDEIAQAIRSLKPEIYGIGAYIWDYNEMVSKHRAARAEEIRAALAADPELAKDVALTPSERKDWEVGPKSAVPRQPKPELTEAELQVANAPAPGSRTR